MTPGSNHFPFLSFFFLFLPMHPRLRHPFIRFRRWRPAMPVGMDSIKGLSIVTRDAYILGEVVDARYDPRTWEVAGLVVRSSRTASGMLNAGAGRSMILLKPGRLAVMDVMLSDMDFGALSGSVAADSGALPAVSALAGMRLRTSDGFLLGTAERAMIDTAEWTVQSLEVKLDKGAMAELGLKRGLLSKAAASLPVADVASVGDAILLSPTVAELKEDMAIG